MITKNGMRGEPAWMLWPHGNICLHLTDTTMRRAWRTWGVRMNVHIIGSRPVRQLQSGNYLGF